MTRHQRYTAIQQALQRARECIPHAPTSVDAYALKELARAVELLNVCDCDECSAPNAPEQSP